LVHYACRCYPAGHQSPWHEWHRGLPKT
jgi:hypothetical protein